MSRPGLTLVTGAGGFIGRRLVNVLRVRGDEAVGWTRATVDLTDAEAVHRAMAALRPTTIIHLAASTPANAADDPAQASVDVVMLENIVANAPDNCRLIHTGSVSEYGRSGHFDEADLRQPRSAYGAAKAAATDRALTMAATGRFDIRVARLFGVYGPGEAAQRLVPHLVAHLAAGRRVPLAPRGQVRDLAHVDDVCDALIRIAEADTILFPTINIGTGVGVAVQHVCEMVADLLGADRALLDFGALPRRVIDEDSLIARTDRLAMVGPVPPQHWLAGENSKAAAYVRGCARTTDHAAH